MSAASDTIAAIATAPGRGGIAVLRISGPGTLAVLHGLFRSAAAPKAFAFIPRHLHYGQALDSLGRPLDEVLAVFMPGPRSFTGEDTGEIHCHGGPAISSALLEAALALGARHAAPGEFTRRAFLNGRLDLTQAEAVAELVAARSLEGARLARARLEGRLGAQIGALRAGLDALRTEVVLAVDFAEEEAELLPGPAFKRALDEARQGILALLKAYERARFWREGALAVLAGRVNAGKSSLLNALLGRERAIVSALPGTTRDYIEEDLNLDGLCLRLIDTAGLRQSGDMIENEGMRRASDLAERADLVLLVCDMGLELEKAGGTAPLALAQDLNAEVEFLRKHPDLLATGRLALVMNKADTVRARACDLPILAGDLARRLLASAGAPPDGLAPAGAPPDGLAPAGAPPDGLAPAGAPPDGLAPAGAPPPDGKEVEKNPGSKAAFFPACPVFAVSATSGLLLDELARGIRACLTQGGNMSGNKSGNGAAADAAQGDIAPNLRQSALLRQSLAELEALALALEAGHPPDILALHLEAAARHLDEVTGSSSSEELLDAVFSSFCIGK